MDPSQFRSKGRARVRLRSLFLSLERTFPSSTMKGLSMLDPSTSSTASMPFPHGDVNATIGRKGVQIFRVQAKGEE